MISNITKCANMFMLQTICANDIGSISIVETIIYIMLSKVCVSMIVIFVGIISNKSEWTMRFHMWMRYILSSWNRAQKNVYLKSVIMCLCVLWLLLILCDSNSGYVIVIHICIFYRFHTMHIVYKNVIFNPFLSIFAGPHLKREKAQNLFKLAIIKRD